MARMTSRQRILSAMRGEPVDRVPVVIRGVNPYERFMNWRGEAHPSYAPLLELVRNCCDTEHLLAIGRGFFLNGADLVITSRVRECQGWRETHATLETPLGPLTAIHREGLESYSHATIKHWITCEEDVERFLALPFACAEADVPSYRAAEKTLGDRGYTLPYLDSPIGWVHALLGSELLAIWSVEAPELLHRLLEATQERCLTFVRSFLEATEVPVLGLQGQETVTPPLLSPACFNDLVVRYEAPLIREIHRHGAMVYVHCHGYMNAVIERFADMGVDVLHPVEAPPMGDITLLEAKRRVGGCVCLAGNIQIGDIMSCDRQEIIAQVQQTIQDGMPGGRFILTLSATPFERVLSQRTFDNMRALVLTALEHGRYWA